MNNYSYEEYMNNLLGSCMPAQRNMVVNTMEPYEEGNAFITYSNQANNELEECYPEIYKIVYPMICKRCLYINEEITEELVERITNEIYENFEQEECPEETRSAQIKVNYSNIRNNRNIRYAPRNDKNNNETEGKRQRNFLLNDLIKILVLRELLGTGRRPPRPFPFPRPGRPPMPRPPRL